jgi:serpin B
MRRQQLARAIYIALALAITAAGLAGCAASVPAARVVMADTVRSDKPRQSAAALDEARVPELVAGNTGFAIDVYRALFNGEQNLLYSPYSLSLALAMTYAGARGETERQMAGAMHYTLPRAELHTAFNALDQALAGRGEGESLHFTIVNAVWGQQGHAFLEPFLDTLAEQYGAGLRGADLMQAEDARRIINQWISDQTERRIRELLPPGAVDEETVLVLNNVVTFKAAWQHAFPEAHTSDGPFTLLDGDQVTVPMMSQLAELGYAEGAGVQVVELPYAGEELSMVILLPEQGSFERFARSLDVQKIAVWLDRLERRGVALTMPRFRFDATLRLKDTLVELGMVDAFDEADFSGMDGTQELFIDEMYHQALVAVDEAGTEATAASAVVMAIKGGPSMEQEVKIDRPFIFMIRDIETGTILFLGHVVDPAA